MLATMEVLPVHHVKLDSLLRTLEASIVKSAQKVTQRMAMVKLNVSKKKLRSRLWSQLWNQPQWQCLAMFVQLNLTQLEVVKFYWPMGI